MLFDNQQKLPYRALKFVTVFHHVLAQSHLPRRPVLLSFYVDDCIGLEVSCIFRTSILRDIMARERQ